MLRRMDFSLKLALSLISSSLIMQSSMSFCSFLSTYKLASSFFSKTTSSPVESIFSFRYAAAFNTRAILSNSPILSVMPTLFFAIISPTSSIAITGESKYLPRIIIASSVRFCSRFASARLYSGIKSRILRFAAVDNAFSAISDKILSKSSNLIVRAFIVI